jgi:hypothetical protein
LTPGARTGNLVLNPHPLPPEMIPPNLAPRALAFHGSAGLSAGVRSQQNKTKCGQRSRLTQPYPYDQGPG